MRSLRALVHLILAVAVLTAAVAQAVTGAALVEAGSRHHDGRVASKVDAAHAAHDHTAANERQTHKADACQAACCFMPVQESARLAEGRPVRFSCPVSYVGLVSALSGRTRDPDPEIPKIAA